MHAVKPNEPADEVATLQKHAVTPAGMAAEALPFTPAIRSGDLLFVSGQASVDASGRIVSGSFEREMRASMENMRRVLEAGGCDFGDVVQVRAYVDDPRDLPEFNVLYREYFADPLPARTTLTRCLGVIKFEIDATARVPVREP